MTHNYTILAFCAGLALAAACGGDSSAGDSSGSETGECTIGALDCPCTAGGACDSGLTCEMQVCVLDGSEGYESNGDGDGDAGDGDGDSGDGDGDGDGDPPPNCGDTVVDHDEGEQCDDGNTQDGDGCSSTCQVEVGGACGNGMLEPGNDEECDDGNTQDGDGCSSNCQFEPVGANCGDASVDAEEVCDDGNTQNGDSCNPTCNLGNTTSLFAGGVGVAGFMDGVGTNARFGNVGNLAVDNTYLWVSDAANNCIRRVEIATATVLTVAGSSTPGDLDGDGLAARFSGPANITTDGTTLWVADGANRKLKTVDLSPPYTVTTVAGSGMQAVTDGIGNAASFDDMRGLTYYAGHVYLLDANGAVLRRFDPQTNEVLTIAGQVNNPGIVDGMGNQAQFLSPRYMTSDNGGMLYIADTNGYHIRSYNVATTFVGTFAGNGVAGYVDGIGNAASIHRPRGMTSDGTSIYFTEFNQHTIRQGELATASITTLAGQHCNGAMTCNGGYTEGVGTAAVFNGPFDVKFHYPSSSLFVFDGTNAVIRRVQ
jgi:cysteine-rich repeat protein